MQNADAKLMLNDAKSINDAKLMQNSDAKIENTLYVSSNFVQFSFLIFSFYSTYLMLKFDH